MAVKAANNAATLMIKQIGYAEKGMIFFLNKKDTMRPLSHHLILIFVFTEIS